jgi:hypothetical protein
MSPFQNGSSSSSSNRGGIINDGGYFSSGDVNFGSGENVCRVSSFSDINGIKSIKSSMNGGGVPAQFACGSTMPSSAS